MSMKFIMIGCGWRAQYFLRAAEILSDRLEVSAIVMHSEKRAQEIQQETGILTTTDLENCIRYKAGICFVVCTEKCYERMDFATMQVADSRTL